VIETELHPDNKNRKGFFLPERVLEASHSNPEGMRKGSFRRSITLLLDSTFLYSGSSWVLSYSYALILPSGHSTYLCFSLLSNLVIFLCLS
jgi:hypothetical protein